MSEYIILKEAAAILRCTKRTVERLVEKGILKPYQVEGTGKALLYKREDVEGLIKPRESVRHNPA
jgi:excisionase family DNA binding protein